MEKEKQKHKEKMFRLLRQCQEQIQNLSNFTARQYQYVAPYQVQEWVKHTRVEQTRQIIGTETPIEIQHQVRPRVQSPSPLVKAHKAQFAEQVICETEPKELVSVEEPDQKQRVASYVQTVIDSCIATCSLKTTKKANFTKVM